MNENSEIKMNWFELFESMFLVLNAVYQNFSDEEKKKLENVECQDDLSCYLSVICPYTFTGFSSADPAYFEEFYNFMKDKTIGEDYGYSLICNYLETEDYYHNVLEYFESYGKEDFITATKDFLTNNERLGKDWILPQINVKEEFKLK